jgi:uncharacterized protein YrzB (UPF0473 family)
MDNENNEFGADFITITDEDGEEFELEHLDTFELDGTEYMAFLPAETPETDPDYGYVFLKVIEEDGEEVFATIDDETEQDRVYDAFMERLFDEDDD